MAVSPVVASQPIAEQILMFFRHLFSAQGFPARWGCGEWTPFHGWLYVASDIAVWSAYFTIPILLLTLVSRRRDVPFPRVFWLFSAFIFACGATHLIDALMFWFPAYRLSAVVLLLTGVISWVTVFALMRTLPVAMSLKSPAALEQIVNERTQTLRERESEINKLNDALEQRVEERTQQLQQMNHELESFSYTVSHDLRAPLRSIDGFSQIVMENYGNQLDSQGRDYLERIRRSSQQMSRLIDDLLNLSRLSRDPLNWEEDIDLSQIVTDIVADLRVQDPERRVDVEIQPGITVGGDRSLLQVVMQNLLLNAWKFTSRNEAARISFSLTADDAGQPVYCVQDNGVGFDETYKDKLFGTFQRLHSSSEFPGNGIGLASVRRIINRHGGTVWAESPLKLGATFCFTIGPVQASVEFLRQEDGTA